jgi:polyphosphate glucokinase
MAHVGAARESDALRTLTIDIGGTGIKMLPIDAQGHPLAERVRELTPQPSYPDAVLAVIKNMLAAQSEYDRKRATTVDYVAISDASV